MAGILVITLLFFRVLFMLKIQYEKLGNVILQCFIHTQMSVYLRPPRVPTPPTSPTDARLLHTLPFALAPPHSPPDSYFHRDHEPLGCSNSDHRSPRRLTPNPFLTDRTPMGPWVSGSPRASVYGLGARSEAHLSLSAGMVSRPKH